MPCLDNYDLADQWRTCVAGSEDDEDAEEEGLEFEDNAENDSGRPNRRCESLLIALRNSLMTTWHTHTHVG